MSVKNEMSSHYRQLRASGMSHDQAFAATGSHFKNTLEKKALMRMETRMIKPIDMSNKRAVNPFTRKFDYGDKEKIGFMASKEEIGNSNAFKTEDYFRKEFSGEGINKARELIGLQPLSEKTIKSFEKHGRFKSDYSNYFDEPKSAASGKKSEFADFCKKLGVSTLKG